MLKTLRFILGDQLSRQISSLNDVNKQKDIIFLCEVSDEATYVKHHKKKIVFIFSAMRHFAKSLEAEGFQVEYVTLAKPRQSTSFSDALKSAVKKHNIEKVVITEPSEYRVLKEVQNFEKTLNLPVAILEDCRFLCSKAEFEQWAQNKDTLRMEYFYRYMRKKHHILLQNDKPEGGKWNLDAQNREAADPRLKIPAPFKASPDKITQTVMELVDSHFSEHFGDIEPFHYAVTRQDALQALDNFIDERLERFGAYQDAMLEDEDWLYHSHISFYINIGLLSPMECIKAAEEAYYYNNAPLNSVEGFIRQILGWREYVRGIYWLKMPDYAKENFLEAKNHLPELYWTGETKLNCLKQCIKNTKRNAYAHHIQRLMVLGNFALLMGVHPNYVNEWYLIVYADAFEWVEMPNVTGMILFADGGLLASKPYCASGAYINKMSNYCKNCAYKVSVKNGKDACPFNYLYWDFLHRNKTKLKNNQRLKMPYHTLDKMSDEKISAIKKDAEEFMKAIPKD